MDPRTRELVKLSAAMVIVDEAQRVSLQQPMAKQAGIGTKLLALLALLGVGGGAAYLAGTDRGSNLVNQGVKGLRGAVGEDKDTAKILSRKYQMSNPSNPPLTWNTPFATKEEEMRYADVIKPLLQEMGYFQAPHQRGMKPRAGVGIGGAPKFQYNEAGQRIW